MQLNKRGSKNSLYEELIADGELQRVPLEMVDRDPEQPRSLSEVKLAAKDLAPSIKQNGLVQSPVYWLQDNGRYLIIVGDCRTQATRLLKWKDIPAIVKRFDDNEAARKQICEIRWAENDSKTRKALTPLDEAAFWARYMEEFYTVDGEVKVKEAAEYLGQNQTRLSQFLGINRSSDKVKNIIRKRQITDYQLAYLLARMEKHTGLLDEFIEKLDSGEPTGGIQVLANKMLKKANENEKQKGKNSTGTKDKIEDDKETRKEKDNYKDETKKNETEFNAGKTDNEKNKREQKTSGKVNIGLVILNFKKLTCELQTIANQPQTLTKDDAQELVEILQDWIEQ